MGNNQKLYTAKDIISAVNEKKQFRWSSIPFCIAVLFLQVCYLLPVMQIYFNVQTVVYISIFFTIIFCHDKISLSVIYRTLLILLPYYLIMFFIARPGDAKYGFLHPILLSWHVVFPAILALQLLLRGRRYEILFVLTTFLIIVLYVLFQSFNEMETNDVILREMTSGNTDEEYKLLMMNENVGGFGFSYMCGGAFLCCLANFLFIKTRYKTMRVALLVLIVIFAVFITRAQFTTLLLLSIVGVGYIIFINIGNFKWRLAFLVLIAPLSSVLIPLFISMLVDYFQGTVVGDHLHLFYNSLMGNGEGDNYATSRVQLRSDALQQIMQSPFWGQNVMVQPARYLFSHSHTSVLSYLIATGLIGTISYFYALWVVIRPTTQLFSRKAFLHVVVPFIGYYVVLAFYNPVEAPEMSWAFFCIFPLMTLLINTKVVL